MTPQDEKKLLAWGEKVSKEIHLTVVLPDDQRIGNALTEFCSMLSSLLPKVIIHKKRSEEGGVPTIEVHKRLWFRAVPLGPELDPFLEALLLQETPPKQVSEAFYGRLHKINVPAMLKLFIAPQCPFCPAVVRKLIPLVFATQFIHLQVIDGTMFPEFAEADGIQSAPTLVFENLRWIGNIHLEEVVEVICNRDPEGLSLTTLKNMIKEGDASKLARLMIENHKIFPKFIDILVDEKWPVRLGAMVCVEEIMAHDPYLASQVIEPVWRRFQSLDNQTKGDMIYLMGEIADLDTISVLQSVLMGTGSDELRIAVTEAIETIQSRHK